MLVDSHNRDASGRERARDSTARDTESKNER
jgi:hypothetical protein